MNKIRQTLECIKANSIDCISQEELTNKLQKVSRTRGGLKIKIGFDPTAKDIHLGHTVLLRKLRALQELGHTVYFIVGDFTARIGDPSGRNELRPALSDREIRAHARTYTSQCFKILDKKKTRVIFNSIWYRAFTLNDFFPLLSRYTVARMIERDDFSLRLKEGKPLSLLELVYPLIQGYDSVKLAADIEFGGTDQKFNLIVGRHLQESFGLPPQVVVTMPLLVGLDGKNKMSKSLGNYIGITDHPQDMFGKVMSISDELMYDYYRLLTDIDLDEVKKMHPKEAKLFLASTLVETYHSALSARKARENFEKVFSQKELPQDIPVYRADSDPVDIIEAITQSGLVSSKREARRLLEQKSITSGTLVITEQSLSIPPEGKVLKIGKRRFLRIILKK
ncbi:MAG: tyrosine--tRNA ligase [Candidatus Omnitrophica bacterium]|nr:tyrosine--tRNA ligase [Candidatus Omnitrophota bacterium]